MAQLTSWSPHFLSDFEAFSNKRNVCLDLDSNPGSLACVASVLPFCHGDFLWKRAKVGFLNHLKFHRSPLFLSEINKAISYFIYLVTTLTSWAQQCYLIYLAWGVRLVEEVLVVGTYLFLRPKPVRKLIKRGCWPGIFIVKHFS